MFAVDKPLRSSSMKKTVFFDNMKLPQLVQIVAELAKYGLLPSRNAFARLYELEMEGENVSAALVPILDGAVLRKYVEFKRACHGSLETDSEQTWSNPNSAGEKDYVFVSAMYGSGYAKGEAATGLFERIWELHLT